MMMMVMMINRVSCSASLLSYTCLQSLRLWYSRAMSRRALQEDCQMFSLLTLVAFGIIGTLLVGIQYYAMHTQSWGLSKLWTKSWMVFFLIMTVRGRPDDCTSPPCAS